jgi:hypothetical protein
VEPGPDLVGVGVVEVGEDRQGRAPAVQRRVVVPAGLVGLAEMYQRLSLAVPVAEVTEQRERLLVGGDGVGVPAEMVVRETEAVPAVRLTLTEAELPCQPE